MEGVQSSRSSSFVVRGIASMANAIYELMRRWLLWTMAADLIPNHVAIIMDGNRSCAARRQTEKLSGHEFGYNTLMHIFRNCYELGVKCVSVYTSRIQALGGRSGDADQIFDAGESLSFAPGKAKAAKMAEQMCCIITLLALQHNAKEAANSIFGEISKSFPNGDSGSSNVKKANPNGCMHIPEIAEREKESYLL